MLFTSSVCLWFSVSVGSFFGFPFLGGGVNSGLTGPAAQAAASGAGGGTGSEGSPYFVTGPSIAVGEVLQKSGP